MTESFHPHEEVLDTETPLENKESDRERVGILKRHINKLRSLMIGLLMTSSVVASSSVEAKTPDVVPTDDIELATGGGGGGGGTERSGRTQQETNLEKIETVVASNAKSISEFIQKIPEAEFPNNKITVVPVGVRNSVHSEDPEYYHQMESTRLKGHNSPKGKIPYRYAYISFDNYKITDRMSFSAPSITENDSVHKINITDYAILIVQEENTTITGTDTITTLGPKQVYMINTKNGDVEKGKDFKPDVKLDDVTNSATTSLVNTLRDGGFQKVPESAIEREIDMTGQIGGKLAEIEKKLKNQNL